MLLSVFVTSFLWNIQAPDTPEELRIEFAKGIPVKVGACCGIIVFSGVFCARVMFALGVSEDRAVVAFGPGARAGGGENKVASSDTRVS